MERDEAHNRRQVDLIDLIQQLQTQTSRIAVDTLDVAKAPKARNLNSAQVK